MCTRSNTLAAPETASARSFGDNGPFQGNHEHPGNSDGRAPTSSTASGRSPPQTRSRTGTRRCSAHPHGSDRENAAHQPFGHQGCAPRPASHGPITSDHRRTAEAQTWPMPEQSREMSASAGPQPAIGLPPQGCGGRCARQGRSRRLRQALASGPRTSCRSHWSPNHPDAGATSLSRPVDTRAVTQSQSEGAPSPRRPDDTTCPQPVLHSLALSC